MLDLISQGTEPSQRPGPCDPSLLVLSLPQEQGMKVNSSKELSMCFTEVSGGRVGSAGELATGVCLQVSLGFGALRSHCRPCQMSSWIA